MSDTSRVVWRIKHKIKGYVAWGAIWDSKEKALVQKRSLMTPSAFKLVKVTIRKKPLVVWCLYNSEDNVIGIYLHEPTARGDMQPGRGETVAACKVIV